MTRDHIQQLERRATGALGSTFPLLHCGNTGIEHLRKHALTGLTFFTQGANLLRIQRKRRSKAGRIKIAQRGLVYCTHLLIAPTCNSACAD